MTETTIWFIIFRIVTDVIALVIGNNLLTAYKIEQYIIWY